MTTLYIDADACPVKAEAERVATRLRVPMVLVCNGGLRPSANPLVTLKVVAEGPDEADKWIADQCGPGDVVVTADLPLADRCLKAGARVVTHDGEVLSVANIGPRLATRDLMADLRASNPFMQGGGAGFSKADRSRFLQVLDLNWALPCAARHRGSGCCGRSADAPALHVPCRNHGRPSGSGMRVGAGCPPVSDLPSCCRLAAACSGFCNKRAKARCLALRSHRAWL